MWHLIFERNKRKLIIMPHDDCRDDCMMTVWWLYDDWWWLSLGAAIPKHSYANCAFQTRFPYLILPISLFGAAQLCKLRTSGTHPLSNSDDFLRNYVNCACWARFSYLALLVYGLRQFRVNGGMAWMVHSLQQLTEQGLVNDLGLLPLQAQKIVSRFCALQGWGS